MARNDLGDRREFSRGAGVFQKSFRSLYSIPVIPLFPGTGVSDAAQTGARVPLRPLKSPGGRISPRWRPHGVNHRDIGN